MKPLEFVRILFAVAAFLGAGSANAAAVTCGDGALGIRLTAVDPGLTGGLCFAQLGNLDPGFYVDGGYTLFDVGSTTLTLLGKEEVGTGDASSLLGYTVDGNQFGTWAVSESAWNSWNRVMLGFHFGGGGAQGDSNPDSFVVELAPTDNFGSWALTGTDAVKLTGLSNIYLFGVGPQDVPEPAMLALVGLALLGFAGARRRG